VKYIGIKSIKKVKYKGDVYNLHIANNHNYFANGMLVSNCHGAKAISIQNIAKKCVNAEYRLGFTGTLPTEKIDLWNIYGYLGPKIYEIKSDVLIDKGVLSDITIANIILKYSKEYIEINKGLEYDDEVDLINNNCDRNKILKWIFNNIKDGQNSLVLVRLIDHLNVLKEYLENNIDKKFKIYVIYGEVDTEERERIRKLVNENSNCIILSTYKTCGTGINIPKLHNVIFASSYKSKITILQALGRGMRLHNSKERLILWDIIDDMSYETVYKKGINKGKKKIVKNYLLQHFEERLKYYKDQKFKYISKEFQVDKL
jgi:superfamily II DNA or RNA helicase